MGKTPPISVPARNRRAHSMHLFDDVVSRAEFLAEFVLRGLRQGETSLVVTRSIYWRSTVERLKSRGCPVDTAKERGALLFMDASATLDKFMRRGRVDSTLFRLTVGSLVGSLVQSSPGPLQIYGDMVDLLAEQQHHAEAVQLEELWNSLGENLPFSLACGYSSLNFVQARDRASLAPICKSHAGGVSAAPESALGEFLLTSV